MLHITDGSSASRRLRRAGIHGDFLAWDDALHHGPVPGGLSFLELTEIRAAFVAENEWETLDQARARFSARNTALETLARETEVVIWSSFELFDQLHLLQILDWFEHHRDVMTPPSVIFIDDHLGGGRTGDAELLGLFEQRASAIAPMLGTAAAIWQAFTSPEVQTLVDWSRQKTPDLPFMHQALERLLDEYPGYGDGLSLTERQILEVLELGPLTLPNLFRTVQALESRPFMGDWSFWLELRRLTQSDEPVVRVIGEAPLLLPPQLEPSDARFREQQVALTHLGQQVLEREVDYLSRNRDVRWVGGVKIDQATALRWDRHRRALVDLSGQPLADSSVSAA